MQRRTQFVGHVGQEVALGPVGCLRRVACLDQFQGARPHQFLQVLAVPLQLPLGPFSGQAQALLRLLPGPQSGHLPPPYQITRAIHQQQCQSSDERCRPGLGPDTGIGLVFVDRGDHQPRRVGNNGEVGQHGCATIIPGVLDDVAHTLRRIVGNRVERTPGLGQCQRGLGLMAQRCQIADLIALAPDQICLCGPCWNRPITDQGIQGLVRPPTHIGHAQRCRW